MKLGKLFLSVSLSILVSSCATTSMDSASSSASAIAAAEKARSAASKVGYEWRDTSKMIKAAKKLAAEGKEKEAIQLANKAEEQGKDALSQYKSETSRFATNHN